MSIYDFKVKNASDEEVALSDYKDQVLLIVNVASKCGFTRQYDGLQALYTQYKDQGFTVLGFPSNQFKGQEPGSNEDIQEFCRVNYGVTFPVLAKVDVNGEDEAPLYSYLKAQEYNEFIDVPEDHPSVERFKEMSGPTGLDISWNFNKFLIDRTGKVHGRYASTSEPEDLNETIEALLRE